MRKLCYTNCIMKKWMELRRAKTPPGRCLQVFAVAAALMLAVVIFSSLLEYRCPLRWTLGVECPGCGMTRAAAALLQLDFAGALAFNPLIFVVIALAVFAAWAWVFDRMDLLRRKWLWVLVCGLFFAFWIVRIILFLNGLHPSFVEPDAVLPSFFRWLF